MFVAASLVLARVALGTGSVRPDVAAAILWLVILFAAAVGLGRSFLIEAERGTVLLLQLSVRPAAVFAGKLCYNIALTLALKAAVAAKGDPKKLVAAMEAQRDVPGVLGTVSFGPSDHDAYRSSSYGILEVGGQGPRLLEAYEVK